MEHHPHDKKWIAQQLGKIDRRYTKKVIDGYSATYTENLPDGETIARRVANTRLREFIEKCANTKHK